MAGSLADGLRRRSVLALGGAAVASSFASPVTAAGLPRLVQGPMVGTVAPDRVLLWARANGPFRVSVLLADNPRMEGAREVGTVRAGSAEDYTVRCPIEGLQPGREYHYHMLVEGVRPKNLSKRPPFSFRAAPAGSQGFRLCFGSCLRVQLDPQQRIWDAVNAQRPDLFFWLGDNIYGDSLRGETLAEEYREQRNVPALQPVLRRVPQLAIWDDHDFGLNDGDRSSPVREAALQHFRNYWANPSHGLPDVPGVFFPFSYAGVDFIFLDGRYHRDPNALPDGPHKTQLGADQLDWLKERLRTSRAVFKVLVSGGGWTAAKGPGGDSWASFIHERDALFDFIRDEEIAGVVLLSGDTHVAELNCIPRSTAGGYDLYDLVSSPMAQECSEDWINRRPERRIREPYDGTPSFGVLDFAPHAQRPSLTYSMVNAFGQVMWDPLTLYADELVNGVTTWPAKMDADAIAWHRRLGDDFIQDVGDKA